MSLSIQDRSNSSPSGICGSYVSCSNSEHPGDASPLRSVESTGSVSSLRSSSSKNSSYSRSFRSFKVLSPGSARRRARLQPKANRRGGKNKPIVIRDSSSGEVLLPEGRKSHKNGASLKTGRNENSPLDLSVSRAGPAEALGELRRVLGSIMNHNSNAVRKRTKDVAHEKNCSDQAGLQEELPGLFSTPIFYGHPAFDTSLAADIMFDTPSPVLTSSPKRYPTVHGSSEKDLSSPRLITSSGSVLSLDRVTVDIKPTKECSSKELIARSEEVRESSQMGHERLHQAEVFSVSGIDKANFPASRESLPKKRLRHREKTPQPAYSAAPMESRPDNAPVDIAEHPNEGHKVGNFSEYIKSNTANEHRRSNEGQAPCELDVEGQLVKQKRHYFSSSRDARVGGTTGDPAMPGGLAGQTTEFMVSPTTSFDPMAAVALLMEIVSYPLKLVWKIALSS